MVVQSGTPEDECWPGEHRSAMLHFRCTGASEGRRGFEPVRTATAIVRVPRGREPGGGGQCAGALTAGPEGVGQRTREAGGGGAARKGRGWGAWEDTFPP